MADDDLATLNERKEQAFQRKQEIGARIAEKINQINEYRKQRNQLTSKVRDTKKERDALNTQITAKIAEIKEARPKVQKVEAPVDAKGRPVRPRQLQRDIKLLEEKLETIPMSFESEQKLMKQLKQMKKQYDEMNNAMGVSGALAEKSHEIDELKRKANELHAHVTVLAKESQQYHEKMLTLSQEIEDLKKQEEEAYQQFLAAKEDYLKIAGEARDQQDEFRKARKVERAKFAEEKKKQSEEEQKTLMQRAKEAEEKMLKGEKLTTEDLLALQSLKE